MMLLGGNKLSSSFSHANNQLLHLITCRFAPPHSMNWLCATDSPLGSENPKVDYTSVHLFGPSKSIKSHPDVSWLKPQKGTVKHH